MKDLPILFSGAMVRAILEGRKSQTRRVVKLADLHADYGKRDEASAWVDESYQAEEFGCVDCLKVPFGDEENRTVHRHFPRWERGDRLWVKETWQLAGWDFEDDAQKIRYRADGAGIWQLMPEKDVDKEAAWLSGARWMRDGREIPDTEDQEGCNLEFDASKQQWRPSIFMPRWCSRITLEVERVRVERVHGISEADAIAEGLHQDEKGLWTWGDYQGGSSNPRYAYELLWRMINGDASWEANPWVWVVEFRRVFDSSAVSAVVPSSRL